MPGHNQLLHATHKKGADILLWVECFDVLAGMLYLDCIIWVFEGTDKITKSCMPSHSGRIQSGSQGVPPRSLTPSKSSPASWLKPCGLLTRSCF